MVDARSTHRSLADETLLVKIYKEARYGRTWVDWMHIGDMEQAEAEGIRRGDLAKAGLPRMAALYDYWVWLARG